MTASDTLIAMSTAPSGSTAQVHMNSALARTQKLGLNLASTIEALTANNTSETAQSNITSSIFSNNETAITASSITTLTAVIQCP